MPTKVSIPSEAQKDIKHLCRKYPSVTREVAKLINQLENDERPGDKLQGTGYDVYKVRLPNPSAKRGKSGGFRVIYYVETVDNVYLLKVYSKTEQADIQLELVRQIIDEVLQSNTNDEDDVE